MSRYIDADKLLKSTISKFKCVPLVGVSSYRNGEEYFDGEDFDTLINEAPTADVVEVVRCKDCENSEVDENGNTWCTFYNGRIREMPDGYCWHGKRREE